MVLSGEGVFETLKVVDSQPFATTRHFARMAGAAEALGMPVPSIDDVRAQIEQHLDANPRPLGRLRIDWRATAGGAELTTTSESISAPASSVALTTDSWAVDEHGPRAGIKSTCYENFAHARQRAQAAGSDDALLLNRAGNVCETSTANVFYVLDGVLSTPSLASGCLPGIARALVIELSDAVEVDAPPSTLMDASEVFITSSLREVQPVHRIDSRTYPAIGPITAEAMNAWRRLTSASADPPLPDCPR